MNFRLGLLLISLSSVVCCSSGAAPQKHTVLKGSVQAQDFGRWGIQVDAQANKAPTITRVTAFSAAEQWGLQAGDVITSAEFATDSAKIVVKRVGKTYTAFLSTKVNQRYGSNAETSEPGSSSENADPGSNRKASSPPKKAQKSPLDSMSGEYVGELPDNQVIHTKLEHGSRDLMTGSYTVEGQHGAYSGQLDSFQILSDHQIECTWHDTYGQGDLIIDFDADFNSFDGGWTPNINSTARISWPGRRVGRR